MLQVKGYGELELTVVVEGCTIPCILIDGGSAINLMLKDMAFNLGYTSFEATDQVFRMADQPRVLIVWRTNITL